MTDAERLLRRVVDLAGDLADQIRDQPPPVDPAYAAAMHLVSMQIADLAVVAAAKLRAASGGSQ